MVQLARAAEYAFKGIQTARTGHTESDTTSSALDTWWEFPNPIATPSHICNKHTRTDTR